MLSRKHFLTVGTAFAIAGSALFFPKAAFAQTVDGKPEVKAEVLADVTRILTSQAFVPTIDFSKWPSFLEAESKKLEAAKNDDEFQQAVNEALQKFGASHIVLGTPKIQEQRLTNKVVGIGITSLPDPLGLFITRVVPGAPADKGGLVPGDIIVEVEGKKPVGISGIPGEEGTDVHIKVKHESGKIQAVTLTRKPFSTVRKEELTWPTPDTAKLTVYTFDRAYDRSNVDKLMEDASKAKHLILDLRDNGGGMVVNLQHLLGKFIENKDPIGTFVNKPMVNVYKKETNKTVLDVNEIAAWSRKDERFARNQIMPIRQKDQPVYGGNVIVLVNQSSGSASEMCAMALKEIAFARVVGTKSAGAVLVSIINPIAGKFTLQYPISDYVTLRGVRIEGKGVDPDVKADVRVRIPGKPDPAVESALLLFKSMGRIGEHTSIVSNAGKGSK